MTELFWGKQRTFYGKPSLERKWQNYFDTGMVNRASTKIDEKIGADVFEEGPRSGFSLRDWKENLPRKRAIQGSEFLGQSLTYIVTPKITTLATTKQGMIHATQRLNGLKSSFPSASPRCRCCCTLIRRSPADEANNPPQQPCDPQPVCFLTLLIPKLSASEHLLRVFFFFFQYFFSF